MAYELGDNTLQNAAQQLEELKVDSEEDMDSLDKDLQDANHKNLGLIKPVATKSAATKPKGEIKKLTSYGPKKTT